MTPAQLQSINAKINVATQLANKLIAQQAQALPNQPNEYDAREQFRHMTFMHLGQCKNIDEIELIMELYDAVILEVPCTLELHRATSYQLAIRDLDMLARRLHLGEPHGNTR